MERKEGFFLDLHHTKNLPNSQAPRQFLPMSDPNCPRSVAIKNSEKRLMWNGSHPSAFFCNHCRLQESSRLERYLIGSEHRLLLQRTQVWYLVPMLGLITTASPTEGDMILFSRFSKTFALCEHTTHKHTHILTIKRIELTILLKDRR